MSGIGEFGDGRVSFQHLWGLRFLLDSYAPHAPPLLPDILFR